MSDNFVSNNIWLNFSDLGTDFSVAAESRIPTLGFGVILEV